MKENRKVKIIGLTGRSGSGKGYVCSKFLLLGIEAIDTDKLSRKVTEKGSECLAELAEYFGDEILNADGTLNRRYLASVAFASAEKTSVLNRITHKYIIAETEKLISDAEKRGKELILVDAPQLFESGIDSICDRIIGVIATDEKCIERILERDGIDVTEAVKRLSRQHGNEYFIGKCDYIIENNDVEDIPKTVRELAERLKIE